MQIKARLRKDRDNDIRDAIRRLDLKEIQLSSVVREGTRIVLYRLGVLEKVEKGVSHERCS